MKYSKKVNEAFPPSSSNASIDTVAQALSFVASEKRSSEAWFRLAGERNDMSMKCLMANRVDAARTHQEIGRVFIKRGAQTMTDTEKDAYIKRLEESIMKARIYDGYSCNFCETGKREGDAYEATENNFSEGRAFHATGCIVRVIAKRRGLK